MKMRLMRKIDWYVGVPLCYIFAVFKRVKNIFLKKNLKEIKKILVIKFLGIGSIILTTPTINALKNEFAGAKIYFLSFKNNKEILDLLNLTDKNYFIETETILKFILSTFKVIYQLRKEKIDIMFDLEFFSKFPLVISSLIGAKKKAGFYLTLEPWRKSLLDYHGYYNHYYHVKNIFLSLVYLVKEGDPYYLKFDGYIKRYPFPSLTMTEIDMRNIVQKLSDLGWRNEKIILINPNAGPELAPELKRWPQSHFSSLIEKISQEYLEVLIVLIGSKAEKPYVQKVIDLVSKKNNRNIINLAGETSLKELLCLFELSSLFISVDSGPMHLAALTKIPIIGLFGAETPVLYAPLSSNSVVLCKNLYCVPMFTVYNGKRSELKENMLVKSISVGEVFNKIREML